MSVSLQKGQDFSVPRDKTFIPADDQEEHPPIPENTTWNGFMVVLKFTAELVAKVAIFAILGVAAYFLIPVVAMPFFIFVGTTVLTRLVVKILDVYNLTCFNNFKRDVAKFFESYPMVQLIALLVGVLLCPLSIIAGSVVGGAAGCLHGFLMGIEIIRQNLQISRAEDPEYNTPAKKFAENI